VLEPINKELFPSFCVSVILGKISIVCNDVKSKLSIRGFTVGVERGELRTKFRGLRKFFRQLIEFAYIIVRLANTLEGTPGDRLRDEITNNSVDGRCRFELSIQSSPPMFTGGDLLPGSISDQTSLNFDNKCF
jgi:hypothetical protein